MLQDWDSFILAVGAAATRLYKPCGRAVGLITEKSLGPYAIAAASTFLLFAGVYGAWDLTLWIIKNRGKDAATR